MGRKRIAEKNKKVLEAIKNGTAEVVLDPDGKRRIRTKNTAVRRSFLGTRIFYNCPKCGRVLEFKKKKHKNQCMRCGQALDWGEYGNMAGVYLLILNAEDAYYWAKQYQYFNGETYDIDLEAWRLISREFPAIMFYPFPDGKGYGRFMREAAKDATIITYF